MHTLGSGTIAIGSLSLVLSLNSGGASAQNSAANTATEASPEGLEEIVVTGTRQTGLKAADSAAPIQILGAEILARTASQPDLIQTLAAIVPSLTAQAFGLDASNATLQAKLRESHISPAFSKTNPEYFKRKIGSECPCRRNRIGGTPIFTFPLPVRQK